MSQSGGFNGNGTYYVNTDMSNTFLDKYSWPSNFGAKSYNNGATTSSPSTTYVSQPTSEFTSTSNVVTKAPSGLSLPTNYLKTISPTANVTSGGYATLDVISLYDSSGIPISYNNNTGGTNYAYLTYFTYDSDSSYSSSGKGSYTNTFSVYFQLSGYLDSSSGTSYNQDIIDISGNNLGQPIFTATTTQTTPSTTGSAVNYTEISAYQNACYYNSTDTQLGGTLCASFPSSSLKLSTLSGQSATGTISIVQSDVSNPWYPGNGSNYGTSSSTYSSAFTPYNYYNNNVSSTIYPQLGTITFNITKNN